MSNKLYSEESIQAIANSIRAKNGTSETYTVSEMSTAISALPTNLTTKTITANGTYNASSDNADGYSSVTVNVEGYAKKSIANTPTDIATFNASALPMPSLTVGIEATQSGSGDPSPQNVRPIIGVSAVNVYDNNGNWWDEQYEIYGSGASARIGSKNPIPCKGGFTYYITQPPAYGWKFYDKDMNVLATYYNKTYTAPQNACFMSFQLDDAYGTTYNHDVCISTVSDDYYTPYNGTTYTTTLKDGQGNPMTCYGGTLDVVSGVMTVDRVMFALDGSENWATDIVGDNKRRFTCTSLIDLGVTTTTTFDAISNIYVNTKSASYIDLSEVFILRYLSQYNQNRIDIMTEAYQDVASFKAFLNSTNMQIVYELATPEEIPQDSLSIATQEGTNNLWADSGDVQSGEYMEAL